VVTPPTPTDVREWFSALASGTMAPQEAAALARPWVAERERDVADRRLMRWLARLGGADLESAPGALLYGPLDFHEWLVEYEEAMGQE